MSIWMLGLALQKKLGCDRDLGGRSVAAVCVRTVRMRRLEPRRAAPQGSVRHSHFQREPGKSGGVEQAAGLAVGP